MREETVPRTAIALALTPDAPRACRRGLRAALAHLADEDRVAVEIAASEAVAAMLYAAPGSPGDSVIVTLDDQPGAIVVRLHSAHPLGLLHAAVVVAGRLTHDPAVLLHLALRLITALADELTIADVRGGTVVTIVRRVRAARAPERAIG